MNLLSCFLENVNVWLSVSRTDNIPNRAACPNGQWLDWEDPSCSVLMADLEMGLVRLCSRTDGPLLHHHTVLDYVRGGSSQQLMETADHWRIPSGSTLAGLVIVFILKRNFSSFHVTHDIIMLVFFLDFLILFLGSFTHTDAVICQVLWII